MPTSAPDLEMRATEFLAPNEKAAGHNAVLLLFYAIFVRLLLTGV